MKLKKVESCLKLLIELSIRNEECEKCNPED